MKKSLTFLFFLCFCKGILFSQNDPTIKPLIFEVHAYFNKVNSQSLFIDNSKLSFGSEILVPVLNHSRITPIVGVSLSRLSWINDSVDFVPYNLTIVPATVKIYDLSAPFLCRTYINEGKNIFVESGVSISLNFEGKLILGKNSHDPLNRDIREITIASNPIVAYRIGIGFFYKKMFLNLGYNQSLKEPFGLDLNFGKIGYYKAGVGIRIN